jgi:hypothetical protein
MPSESTLKIVRHPEPTPQTAVYRVGSTHIEVRVWPLSGGPHDPPPGSVLMPGVCYLSIQAVDFRGEGPSPEPPSVFRGG